MDKNLDDLIAELKNTIDQIKEHHEWSCDDKGAMQIFEVVGDGIQPVLHNYKWREYLLINATNKHLSKSAGNHGSDGKTVQEIESKSAKSKTKNLSGKESIGMYDKIASRVDQDKELDIDHILDFIENSPIPIDKNTLVDFIKKNPAKGTNRTIEFNTTRRANKIIDILIDKEIIQKDEFENYEITKNPRLTINWSPTLLKLGVARHELTVFGLFSQTAVRPYLCLLCKSEDIEENLAHLFEEKFKLYEKQMKGRGISESKGKGTSANDAVQIKLKDVLSLPSAIIIEINTGIMSNENISVNQSLESILLKKCGTKDIKNRLIKYIKYSEEKKKEEKEKKNIKQKKIALK